MITRLQVENYRCIREATLDLEPLTVLVGPNGSGKSTFMRALQPAFGDSGDRWRHDPSLNARLSATFTNGRVNIAESFGHRDTVDWDPYVVQPVHLDVNALRNPNQVQHATRLNVDGSNLANVFATLTRVQQGDLAKRLCTLIPTFADVDVEPVGTGHHRCRFQDKWSSAIWYPPDQVSDGTMLVLAYLCLQSQPQSPDLLAIEEPERGLHPYLIGQLVDLLRRISQGAVGPKATQVVLATHSSELLEFAKPEEVRFLSRDPNDGGTTVEKIDLTSPDWKQAFDEYRQSLGEAWLAGGLGGVP